MPFTLDEVVPWGRMFDEYVAMFDLPDDFLQYRVLGCGDGPAAFNAETTLLGGSVVSVDPIYAFTADEIRSRIEAVAPTMAEQTRQNADEFVWDYIPDVDALIAMRLTAMEIFLDDYPQGLADGRYIAGSLPELPFDDGAFDVALCSHFLFLYSAHFDAEFHVASIMELCRVAHEARIFPLLELGSQPSRHLDAVLGQLEKAGYMISIDPVPYEFQRGGNHMLRVAKPVG